MTLLVLSKMQPTSTNKMTDCLQKMGIVPPKVFSDVCSPIFVQQIKASIENYPTLKQSVIDKNKHNSKKTKASDDRLAQKIARGLA